MFLLWAFMIGYKWAVEKYSLTLLRSGDYGSPPNWKPWLAQLLVWGFAASFEKVLTAIFVILPLHTRLDAMAAWLETPLVAYPALELILVMVLAPVLLNMVFFWVIDNLIMRKQEARVGEYRQLEEDTDEPLMEPLDMGRSTSRAVARWVVRSADRYLSQGSVRTCISRELSFSSRIEDPYVVKASR